jgi:hypothetical protein
MAMANSTPVHQCLHNVDPRIVMVKSDLVDIISSMANVSRQSVYTEVHSDLHGRAATFTLVETTFFCGVDLYYTAMASLPPGLWPTWMQYTSSLITDCTYGRGKFRHGKNNFPP